MGNIVGSGRCEAGLYSQTDSFPWHLVPVKERVGMTQHDRVAAVDVNVGMGQCDVAVCRTLEVGMGEVKTAYVFRSVSVGLGKVKQLHCLEGVRPAIGLGAINNIIYHSPEELVTLAMQASQGLRDQDRDSHVPELVCSKCNSTSPPNNSFCGKCGCSLAVVQKSMGETSSSSPQLHVGLTPTVTIVDPTPSNDFDAPPTYSETL